MSAAILWSCSLLHLYVDIGMAKSSRQAPTHWAASPTSAFFFLEFFLTLYMLFGRHIFFKSKRLKKKLSMINFDLFVLKAISLTDVCNVQMFGGKNPQSCLDWPDCKYAESHLQMWIPPNWCLSSSASRHQLEWFDLKQEGHAHSTWIFGIHKYSFQKRS